MERDPDPVNDYDGFAEVYSAENESGLVNAYYERPAMLALAGDVAGQRILDAGCGAGALSAALRDRGADVTGIDASTGMLALARRRLGDDATLQVANLNDRPVFRWRIRSGGRLARTALPSGLGARAGRVAASPQA